MPYRGVSDDNYYFTGWKQGDGPDLEYRPRQFVKEPSEGAKTRQRFNEYSRHRDDDRMSHRSGRMTREWHQDWDEFGDEDQATIGHRRSAGRVPTHRRVTYDDEELDHNPTHSHRTRFSDVRQEHAYYEDDDNPDEYFGLHPNQTIRSTGHREWRKDWELYDRMKHSRPDSEDSEYSGESGKPRRVINLRRKEDPNDYVYYLDGKRVQVQRGVTAQTRKDIDDESDTRSVSIVNEQLELDNDKEYYERVFVLIRHCSGCIGKSVSDGIKRAIYDNFPKRVVFAESRGMAGSFEVYLNGKLLFSRTQTGGYPYENDVIKAIHNVRHGRNFTQLRHGASGICSIL